MTQVSMKRVLKQWGKRAVNAVSKELNQLHIKENSRSLDPSGMTEQENADALEHLLFLKEKR